MTIDKEGPFAPYAEKAIAVAEALGDRFGEKTDALALTLVLALNYGAGDAWAGHLLAKEAHPERVVAGLQSCFPAWTPHGFSLPSVLLGLLDHRTGDAAVDRVLTALQQAARAGTGDFGRYLAALSG